MALTKNILKPAKYLLKQYARKVDSLTDSRDKAHFTPQNGAYWIFVGVFFFCFLANQFLYGDGIEMAPTRSHKKNGHIPLIELPSDDPIHRRLGELFYDLEDYGQLESIRPFLPLRPKILDSVPSAVPLFRKGYVLSSAYGDRYHPIHRITKKHFGVDLAAADNTPVYSTAAGTVEHIGNDPEGHGLHIIVAHAHGFKTLYGHLSTVAVALGETLKAHDFIASVGNSGMSTGPHLHYEVIKHGKRINIKIQNI